MKTAEIHSCGELPLFLNAQTAAQILAVQVQKLYDSLHESGLSDSTVRGVHMVLHEAMKAAGHAHLLAVNPMDGAVLPKTETSVRSILLPPSTAVLLRKRKAAMGAAPADSPGWIFPEPFAAGQETPVVPAAAYRRLKAILKKAELIRQMKGDRSAAEAARR